jgi:predicted RNase H-related nuclease YkuK (DUF458 family)
MKVFRTVDGKVVNVTQHTLDILKKHPNVQIHIGSDSQNFGGKTSYATVIAFRYNTNGVHYIHNKFKVDKIKDMWSRLWKEAELSIEIAEWLTKKINVNVQIDMDYNVDENYKSSKLITATKGWANSLGYKVNVKPNNQIATKAADYICR